MIAITLRTLITEESDAYDQISKWLRTLGEDLKKKLHRHSVDVGEVISTELTAKCEQLAKRVEAAKSKQPDFLSDDQIVDQITNLFAGRVGEAVSDARKQEICKIGAARYLSKVPPGFCDEKKPEPERYADLFIWFELLEYAKQQKRPLIFVTSDVKEDWWWEHNGKTIGPRPELMQEMQVEAGLDFYMYNLERFINEAKSFVGIGVAKKEVERAAEEFREIQQTRLDNAEQIAGQVSEITRSTIPFEISVLRKIDIAIRKELGRTLELREFGALLKFLNESSFKSLIKEPLSQELAWALAVRFVRDELPRLGARSEKWVEPRQDESPVS